MHLYMHIYFLTNSLLLGLRAGRCTAIKNTVLFACDPKVVFDHSGGMVHARIRPDAGIMKLLLKAPASFSNDDFHNAKQNALVSICLKQCSSNLQPDFVVVLLKHKRQSCFSISLSNWPFKMCLKLP